MVKCWQEAHFNSWQQEVPKKKLMSGAFQKAHSKRLLKKIRREVHFRISNGGRLLPKNKNKIHGGKLVSKGLWREAHFKGLLAGSSFRRVSGGKLQLRFAQNFGRRTDGELCVVAELTTVRSSH